MDPPATEVPKLPDMVMCGDHPSFTKTELNAKEVKPEDKDKDRPHMPYTRLTPTPSRSEGASSEHGLQALRALAARRRVRSLHARPADPAPPDRALVKAALGSFRWPPYLLCVWVAVLVLTHALHCLVSLLERALPNFKKLCQYFRTWTEQSWKAETELNQRLRPITLAILTAALYSLYAALYAAHCAVLWAIEPLCPDDDKPSAEVGVNITNYVDEVASKTNSCIKQ